MAPSHRYSSSTRVAHQIALVTGGSSGIGLRIAQELGRHGASVVVMGRRAQPLAAAVRLLEDDGIPATSCQGDVRRPADCEAAVATAVDKFGGRRNQAQVPLGEEEANRVAACTTKERAVGR